MNAKGVKQSPLLADDAGVLVRVLIADSHRMNAQLLASALAADAQFSVASPAHNIAELYSRIGSDVQVVVIDIDLEEPRGGLNAVRQLRMSHPDVRTIILLDSLESGPVVESFRCGARGIFARSEDVNALFRCIKSVHEGQISASAQALEFLLDTVMDSAPPRFVSSYGESLLCDREHMVVQLVAEGLTNRAIAVKMGVSEHTVKNHLSRIYAKLGVSNRLDVMFSVLSQRPTSQAAQIVLGKREETPKDDAAAFELYMQQTDHYPLAQYVVGTMYLTGRGVPKDEVTGYMWLLLAEKTSNDVIAKSRETRERFARRINAESCKKAEAMATRHLKMQPRSTNPAHAYIGEFSNLSIGATKTVKGATLAASCS
ncbi:MAG TPA: LuxR C-terminal-related transcriptional regulator [Terriglobales bacterium]